MNYVILSLFVITANTFAQESKNFDISIDVSKEYNRIVNVSLLNKLRNQSLIKNTKKIKDDSKLNEQGTWTKADPITLDLISNYREDIIRIGERYEVLPEAIAGAILGEYSLNFDLIDAAQFKLRDEFGINKLIMTDKVATLLTGKKMTYGLGQVKFEWEKITTEIVNEIEPEHNFVFKNALFEQLGSFRIIAAILKYHQENYINEGIDISNSPGILVTLFNLGESKSRAKITVSQGRDPHPNYMGLFTILYIETIKSKLYEVP